MMGDLWKTDFTIWLDYDTHDEPGCHVIYGQFMPGIVLDIIKWY